MDYDEPPRPTETPFLNEEEIKSGVRLSCQTRVSTDLRISLPVGLFDAKSFKGKVIKIEQMTYDIKLVTFKLDEPMNFKPGQYAQIEVPGFDTVRAYSIASDPKNPMEIELIRSEEHTSELQSRPHLVCRLLLEKKKQKNK